MANDAYAANRRFEFSMPNANRVSHERMTLDELAKEPRELPAKILEDCEVMGVIVYNHNSETIEYRSSKKE